MKNLPKITAALFVGLLLGASMFNGQTAKATGGSLYITKTINPSGTISVPGDNVVGFSCLKKQDWRPTSNVTVEGELVCYVASQ